MKIQPSAEFRTACRRLFQDVLTIVEDPNDLPAFMVRDLNAAEKAKLRAFLDDLVSPRRSDDEIWAVFRGVWAEVGPDRGSARAFFGSLRDHLKQQGY